MTLTLVVLAAGMSTRYGGLKQLAPVGPNGEALMDYAVFDAVKSGCDKLVFVIRHEIQADMTDHVSALVGDTVPAAFVFQEIGSAKRAKPWGTAHAVLAAEPEASSPFMVCNADDFYGAGAYEALAGHLGTQSTAAQWQNMPYALVGYRLRDTLSPFGGVSRAVCDCDNDRYLERLVEVKQIREADSELAGIGESGNGVRLTGDETVSMNLWGLTPSVFPLFRRQFEDFVASDPQDDAEFLIPTAISEQVARGETQLSVLQAGGEWFGMTFSDDKPVVTRRIRELVDRGIYPDDLPAWFRQCR